MIQVGQKCNFSEDLSILLPLYIMLTSFTASHLIRLILRHVGGVDLFDHILFPRVGRLYEENPPEGPLANLSDDRVLFLHCDDVGQQTVMNPVPVGLSGLSCYDGGLY